MSGCSRPQDADREDGDCRLPGALLLRLYARHAAEETPQAVRSAANKGEAHTDRRTDRRTDRQTDRRTNRRTDRRTDRQTDRQTDGPTDRAATNTCSFASGRPAYIKKFFMVGRLVLWLGYQQGVYQKLVKWSFRTGGDIDWLGARGRSRSLSDDCTLTHVVIRQTIQDMDPLVREASCNALGTAMKVVGEKPLMPFLAEVDSIKMTKVRAKSRSLLYIGTFFSDFAFI